MTLMDRIVATPDTCSGHPRIEGTRIRVTDVLGWFAAGMSETEILEDYEQLTQADIRACLAFAAQTVEEHIAAE